eukprot:TRINITY_DN1521_c0_g2_i5.p1 TRINITY_DN1521_c0_g2~~TRINITY_DN1521_c0_g2_i5.p1  ORF type:complete len:584 (-),score=124.95 TRINITY_DN1521_c0_g2_i5:76-1827(-)
MGLFILSYPKPSLEGAKDVDMKFFTSRQDALKDTALLVAHFGPRGPLEATLKAGLEIFPPENIYVCHNGPSEAPFDGGIIGDTMKCVSDISEWYSSILGSSVRNIKYTWTANGNKSLAFFMTALIACKKKYIMLLDNDTLLPSDMFIPIHWLEQSPKIRALAFTIRAQNLRNADGTRNLLAELQDLEYKKSHFIRLFQSKMGSSLYAQGAVSLYERKTLLKILSRHNCTFHGNDLQMGMIMHKMNKDYRMKAVANVPIPTRVPAHFICFPWKTRLAKKSGLSAISRLFVSPYRCVGWGCEHEDRSLFIQRVKSWEMGIHRFAFQLLAMLLFYWKKAVLGIKPFILQELLSIFLDYAGIPLAIYIFWDKDRRVYYGMFMLVIFLGRTLLVVLLDLWLFRRREDLRSGVWIAMLFPMYEFLLLGMRLMGLVYNATTYLPRQRHAKKVRNRTRLPGFILGEFVKLDGKDPPPPREEHFAMFEESVLVNPQVRGARRGDECWEVVAWNEDKRTWDEEVAVEDKSPTNTPTMREGVSDLDTFAIVFLIAMITMAVIIAMYTTDTVIAFAIVIFIFFVVASLAGLLWTE